MSASNKSKAPMRYRTLVKVGGVTASAKPGKAHKTDKAKIMRKFWFNAKYAEVEVATSSQSPDRTLVRTKRLSNVNAAKPIYRMLPNNKSFQIITDYIERPEIAQKSAFNKGSFLKPMRERVRAIGITPGDKLTEDQAKTAVAAIATSSKDLFTSEKEVQDFLKTKNFDGTGLSGIQLIQEGRASRVLARLDDLRFGFQG